MDSIEIVPQKSGKTELAGRRRVGVDLQLRAVELLERGGVRVEKTGRWKAVQKRSVDVGQSRAVARER